MTIRRASTDEIPALAAIARESFMRSVAPHYSEEGVLTFSNFAAADAMAKRVAENCVAYVACEGDRFVGMAMLKNGSHISMLFVPTSEQRRGIGRKLVSAALSEATASTVTVNASPNSEPAYVRLGFRRTSDEKVDHGLRFIPMVYEKSG